MDDQLEPRDPRERRPYLRVGAEWLRPSEVDELPAPDWVGRDVFEDFLHYHGTTRSLRRVLSFIHGKPNRDTIELTFTQSDMIRARVDNPSRTVTFFDPTDETVARTHGFDELAPTLERYIELGGFADRDHLADEG